MIPAWAKTAISILLQTIAKVLSAENDDEREEAFMEAAEAIKKALDEKKFGPSDT